MPIGIGSSVKARSTSFASVAPLTTGAITTTTGSTIVVMVTAFQDAFGGHVTGVSDSKGNTYTQLGATSPGSDGEYNSSFWTAENATGGSGHTISATTGDVGTSTAGIFVVEVTGAAVASVDRFRVSYDVSSPFASQGSGMTAQANEMLIGFAGAGVTFNSGNTTTVDASSNPTSGWGAAIVQETDDSTAAPRGAIFGQAVSATGSYNFAFTIASGPSTCVAAILTLMEAGGGASDPPPHTGYQTSQIQAAWQPGWKVQARPKLNASLLNNPSDGGGYTARDAAMRAINLRWWQPYYPPRRQTFFTLSGSAPPPPVVTSPRRRWSRVRTGRSP